MSAPISPARIDEDLPSDFLPPGNLQVQVPERHRKIVIAYDHSENSDATFAKGIRLGLISPNDHLYIVHIIEQRDLQNLFNASFPGHMDMAAGNQVASTAHSVTEGFMIELKTVLSTNGFQHVTTEVILGDPKQSMVDYCRACKPDFLICSARGLNTVKKVLLGSTSDYLIKNTPCPVLVCKLSAEEIEERKKYAGVKRYHFEHLLGAIKDKFN